MNKMTKLNNLKRYLKSNEYNWFFEQSQRICEMR